MRVLLSLFTLFIALQTPHAFAISEGPAYVSDIASKVTPYLLTHLKYSSFLAHDGKRIVYAQLNVEDSRGLIVISPGRTESIIGFSEILFDLASAGFSTAIIDHRGQGFSDRIVTANDVGTVDSFDDYSSDFAKFVKLVTPRGVKPFLMADSMGSVIALEHMRRQPNAFAKAVIAVPMLKVKTNPLPYAFARAVANTLWFLGRGSHYIPMTGPYDLARKFEGNDFTDSRQRFDLDLVFTRHHPQIAVGGASANWLIESMRAGRILRDNAKHMTTPILMLQAGRESYVDNSSQDAFCTQAPNCSLSKFSKAQHWIFFSGDGLRNQILKQIDAFFTKAVRGPRG